MHPTRHHPKSILTRAIPNRLIILRRLIVKVGGTLALFFIGITLINFFVVSPARVNGRSMEPTYKDEQLFFVNKFIYLFRPPRRFEKIQLVDPERGKLIIKRVLGVPGQTIVVKGGLVYERDATGQDRRINERAYLADDVRTYVLGATSSVAFILEAEQYFVLGDNRPHSTDSRTYGPIGRARLVGKVF